MNNHVLKLFSNCIPVKGFKRSVIYDLCRYECKYIPNILFNILSTFENKSIEFIKEYYKGNEHFIESYYKFLEENDYIFSCNIEEVSNFPKLNLYWDYPSVISNAIIKINHIKRINYQSIFRELSILGCKDYVIDFDRIATLNDLEFILEITNKYSTKTIDFYFHYSEEDDIIDRLVNLCNKNITINKIIIYKSSFNSHIQSKSKVRGNIFYSIQDRINYNNIEKGNFIVNIPTFTEAQKHNLFFNRKIIISSEGYVTNSIFNSNKLWKIDEKNSLLEIIKNKEFTEKWFINKDSILTCRDCECRYMCIDARDPQKISNDLYTFDPSNQCQYNPYIAKWKGQDGWISAVQWIAEHPECQDSAIQNPTYNLNESSLV